MPVDVLLRKHFGTVTIALAFILYGALRQSLDAVHRALNPSRVRVYGARGWDSLLRWLSVASTLFPDVWMSCCQMALAAPKTKRGSTPSKRQN